MGWGPTKEVIEKEVNNYKGLGFFGKAKNLLVSFIIVKSVIHCSYLFYNSFNIFFQFIFYIYPSNNFSVF